MRHLLQHVTAVVLLLAATTAVSAGADAVETHKQIGVHAGLCVLLGENQAQRALALATVSDLVIYVPTTTHARAATCLLYTSDAADE